MSGKGLTDLLMTAVVCLGLATAATYDAALADERAPDTVRIIIAGSMLGSSRVVSDIANLSGVYEDVEREFGTKVEVSAVASGPTATAAVVSGSADFGIMSTVSVIQAGVIGQPIVALMALSSGGDVLFVTRTENKDVGEGFEALKHFDGKRWGVVSIGGIGASFGGLAAAEAGIDWGAQEVIPGGNDMALVGTLLADRLDIVILNIPAATVLTASGEGHVVFDTTSEEAKAAWGNVIGGVLAGNSDFVAKYPELTTAIVRAELKALLEAQEMKDDPAAVYSLYPEDYRQSVDFDNFSAGWSLYVPTFASLTGAITDEDIANTTNVLRQIGRLKPEDEVPASAFDSSFVAAAHKSLAP